jgi:hypothetical protein
MYCPQCGVEYREGYSSCSDCHVLLVHERPRTSDDRSVALGDPNRDPFCAFWQGTDDRVLAELGTVLDEAGIPYRTARREDHLFNRMDQPSLQLGVPASLYEKAEQAVQDAFSAQPLLRDTNGFIPEGLEKKFDFHENELAMDLEDSPLTDDADRSQSSTLLEDWFPEDANVEIWRGNPNDAWMLEMSLKENEIHFRAETGNEMKQLFVVPEDETRAREIIREILEASPPE